MNARTLSRDPRVTSLGLALLSVAHTTPIGCPLQFGVTAFRQESMDGDLRYVQVRRAPIRRLSIREVMAHSPEKSEIRWSRGVHRKVPTESASVSRRDVLVQNAAETSKGDEVTRADEDAASWFGVERAVAPLVYASGNDHALCNPARSMRLAASEAPRLGQRPLVLTPGPVCVRSRSANEEVAHPTDIMARRSRLIGRTNELHRSGGGAAMVERKRWFR